MRRSLESLEDELYQRLTDIALVRFNLEPGDKDFNHFMVKFSYSAKLRFDVETFLERIRSGNKDKIHASGLQVDSGIENSTKDPVLQILIHP